MRSSVFSPIEPVAPSTDMRFMRAPRGSISRMEVADGNTRDLLPKQQPAARRRRIAQRDEAGEHGRHHQSIDAIEQAAMARDKLARILGAKAALDPAFEQVAKLARNR